MTTSSGYAQAARDPPRQARSSRDAARSIWASAYQDCRHCHVDASPARTESAVTPSSTSSRCLPEAQRAHRRHHRRSAGTTSTVPRACRFSAHAGTARDRPMQPHHSERIWAGTRQSSWQVKRSRSSRRCPTTDDQRRRQRGAGVFDTSISGIRRLNALGYGKPDSAHKLNLVYNPLGGHLHRTRGTRGRLSAALQDDFGLSFNALYTLTNMPIARFRHDLVRGGQPRPTSTSSKPPSTRPQSGASCAVAWSAWANGRLFDCDFNQMLNMALVQDVWSIDNFEEDVPSSIQTGTAWAVPPVRAPAAAARSVTALLDCRSCRRLCDLDKLRLAHPDWHNRPVPSIGPEDARLLILGLAPGRLGANRTGVPFIGDRSAAWLCTRLRAAGCLDAENRPLNVRISNAVKCLPPKNHPTAAEIKRCVKKWTRHELAAPRVVFALGGCPSGPQGARMHPEHSPIWARKHARPGLNHHGR